MRHNSERVPGKNYRPLGGVPLYRHVVGALLATPSVTEVVIDTDSDTIWEDAAEAFPEVVLVRRPEHLRDGDLSMNLVLENTLRHATGSTILQTHSTNPFVRPETFEAAIALFEADEECDSVFSVTRIQGRLWDADLVPMNHDLAVLLRTQDLAPVYLENSCFYLFGRDRFAVTGNRIGSSPRVVEMDPIEATDIDAESDFALAVAIEKEGIAARR